MTKKTNEAKTWGHFKLFGNNSAEMRESYLNSYFFPVAMHMFRHDKYIAGIYLAFAQYWNDEASDAVHAEIIPVADQAVSFKTAVSQTFEALSGYELQLQAHRRLFGSPHSGPYWDNGDLVTAFASYTMEGFSQEDEHAESYAPYLFCWREKWKSQMKNAKPHEINYQLHYKILQPTPIRSHLEDILPDWMSHYIKDKSKITELTKEDWNKIHDI